MIVLTLIMGIGGLLGGAYLGNRLARNASASATNKTLATLAFAALGGAGGLYAYFYLLAAN